MPIKKIVLVLAIAVFLPTVPAIFLLHSSRSTPIVRVIKECSSSVVNISTERNVSLEGHP